VAEQLVTVRQARVRSPRRDLLYIWLLALLLRLACVAWLSPGPSWDGVIYERAAEQLARGEGYTRRILGETAEAKPTAFFPPGFPALLSLLHRQAGGPELDSWLQVLASSSLVPLAWLLGRRLGGYRAGRHAAWLVALWPGGILLAASWFSEPVFSALMGFALIPWLYARARTRFRAMLWTAGLLGLAAYVRSTALAVAVCVGAATGLLAWSSPAARFGRTVLGAGLALAISCVPLAPWVVRNQLALGAPVLVSTNGGFNLLLGTVGEGSYMSLDPAMDCPRGLTEIAADACRNERALQRIAADPWAWAARGVLKVLHTVGHDSAPVQSLFGSASKEGPRARTALSALALCRGFWLPFMALAWVGALHLVRERGLRTRGVLLAAPLVGVLALHFVYIGGDRYHAPLVPMFAALAGLALVRIFPPRPYSTRGKLTGGALRR
jgi:4-amino-4-deoxy-L-arabinose transferase-like glycosyltransferase